MEERIRETLRPREGVLFGYLFGSAARGRMHAESDVDVAVFLGPGVDPIETKRSLTVDLMEALGCDAVDVTVLNAAGPGLWCSVLKDGILLIDRDPEVRAEAEVRALREYWDFEPRRRILEEALLREIRGWSRGA